MKNLIFFGLILFLSCQGNQEIVEEKVVTVLDEPESPEDRKHSALNQHDGDGFKQGKWIVFGKDWPEKGFPADGKIEEGNYHNDKKIGEWSYYDIDGTLTQTSNYTEGALNGITFNWDYKIKIMTEIEYDMDRILCVTSRTMEE